jgi:predicted amidohydrolase YtcJ
MNDPAAEQRRSLLVIADAVHSLAASVPARALLVRGGRVQAVGSAEAMRSLDPQAPVLDLRGSTITPGLTDAHVHLTEWAFSRREVELGSAASPAAAARLVADHLDRRPVPWVRGQGWNANLWHGATPHRRVLDEVVADRPLALQSHDMHAVWVNSAALEVAGIDAGTPDPEGGHIVRDEDGQPTGLLLEWAGALVMRTFPVPTTADALEAVLDAQSELHSLGITGVHSLPGVHRIEPEPLPLLLRLHERRELRLRVLQHIRVELLEHAIAVGLRSGFGDEWLRVGGVKMFLDGALGSRTAWMLGPYEQDADRGMNTLEPGAFRDYVRRAAAAGIATTVHAIGDAAVSLALDVLADPAVRVPALPHRIEHLQCCPVERLGDAAAAGIVCSMQPSHLMTDWRIADRHWGEHRNRGTFAVGSVLRHGTILAFGSDVPVEPVDPRLGLHAAITRQDQDGQPSGGWFAGERIEPLDALRGYTIGPARAAGLPAPAGTLAPGAPADFVAWDHDPLTRPAAIPRMRCVAAVIDGVLTHRA